MRMNASFSPTLLKIDKIGNSAGMVLPKEMLGRLGASIGDTLTASVEEDGVTLRRSDDEFETQMAAAREVMARRKRALRELAK